MNLSFCFFFSGMFPSIWWWERGASSFSAGWPSWTSMEKSWPTAEKTNLRKWQGKTFNSAFNAYCCGLGLLMATQGVTVWWYCTKRIMFIVWYLKEVKCQVPIFLNTFNRFKSNVLSVWKTERRKFNYQNFQIYFYGLEKQLK